MIRALALILTLAVTIAASPSFACEVVTSEDSRSHSRDLKNVRDTIEHATVIVDGEVVRAWTKDMPALVRVEHVLKGYPPDFIEVGGPSAGMDCTIALDEVGIRSRMILFGGPNVYDLVTDESYASMEDRLLHSDRRKVWPYRPGAAKTD